MVSTTYRLEELLTGKGSKYRLTIIASRRARELNAGAPLLIKSEARKTTSLALEEVLQGKIKYERRAKPSPEVTTPDLRRESPAEAEKEKEALSEAKKKKKKKKKGKSR